MIVLEELGSGWFEPFEDLADITQYINKQLQAMVDSFSSFKRDRPSGWSSFCTSIHAGATCGHEKPLKLARKLKFLAADVEQYIVKPELPT